MEWFWYCIAALGAGVGTGGGMMMLVVFTAFLGMELKTAVGTSTFIMTFTALIASVSHILIHPAILLEKWNVMLLCISVATAASLTSARFANRVNNRTVGLATGAVLTVLGGWMLLLNFRPQIGAFPVAAGTIRCFVRLILYIIPCVLVLLPVRLFTGIPSFVFRKLLHIVAFTCVTLMLVSAESWQAAALTSLIIAFIAYPLLSLAEKESWYDGLFVQKSGGEIKRSLLMLFFMFAAVITTAWGLLGKPQAAAAAILMWGVGDAAAALAGIPLGRHKVRFPPVNGKKSWEGSAAMFVTSFATGLCLLRLQYGYPAGLAAGAALLGAAAGTLTELLSQSEWDTVTVPVVILAVMLWLL